APGRHPGGLEQRQLFVVAAPLGGAGKDIAKLATDLARTDLVDSEEVVAGLGIEGLPPVSEEGGVGHCAGVDLAGRGEARTDRVDVRARREPFAGDEGLGRRGGRCDDGGAWDRVPGPR